VNTKITRTKRHLINFFDAFSNAAEQSVGLVLEYMDGGTLQDIAVSGGCSEHVIASIAQQCLLGLQFLHTNHQIHRDLKPSNILLNTNGQVKLSDLGIARNMNEGQEKNISKTRQALHYDIDGDVNKTFDNLQCNRLQKGKTLKDANLASTFVGTVTYMSPERIDGLGYSYSSDVWSLGLSLITAAVGKSPIPNDCFWSVTKNVRDEDPPSLRDDDHRWSDEFRNFIKLCLTKDQTLRPSCEELLEHDFIRKYASLSNNNKPGIIDEKCDTANCVREAKKDRDGKEYMDPIEELDHIFDMVRIHMENIISRSTRQSFKSDPPINEKLPMYIASFDQSKNDKSIIPILTTLLLNPGSDQRLAYHLHVTEAEVKRKCCNLAEKLNNQFTS